MFRQRKERDEVISCCERLCVDALVPTARSMVGANPRDLVGRDLRQYRVLAPGWYGIAPRSDCFLIRLSPCNRPFLETFGGPIFV